MACGTSQIKVTDVSMAAKIEAVLPSNNKKERDLKSGAMVLKELAELKFLDPSNTAAIGRYEGMIKFISDKNGVSRAEIEQYFRDGIAAVAVEQFNKIDFGLEHNTTYYNVTLSRNPDTGEFTLYYDRNRKTISGVNLNALSAAMSRNRAFNASDIEQVGAMAALIPAVVYRSWLDKGMTKVDAVSLAAKTIADYYLNPTQANYNLVVGVFGLFNRNQGIDDPVAKAGYKAYRNTLGSLNEPFGVKAGSESLSKGAALAREAIARNPDYSVFTVISTSDAR
jgi:hypothetical protein